MNIDIRVAHSDDLNGADHGFVYEDLDRELGTEALIAEAYKDVAVDYAGFVTEVLGVVSKTPKILLRVSAPTTKRVVA